jgi:hypothetical protein
MGEGRDVYRVFVGKPEGQRPLGRPSGKWEDTMMDLEEVGGGDMDWIELYYTFRIYIYNRRYPALNTRAP